MWSEKCEIRFQDIKELLTTAPIWTLLVEGEGVIVYCDTSCIF